MPEHLATSVTTGVRTETETSPLLAENLIRRGAYWASPELATDGAHWNALADDNAIHAAISTFDEAKEERKSRENVEFILARIEDGERVLDLGCGYGRLAKYLLPSRKLEAYVGVDCSPVMLRKFHERYAASEAERATPLVLVQGDIDRVPLRDASVDVAIVSAVYLHNHKDVTRRSIAEVRRVLRPGGRLLVISSLPHAFGLTALQGKAYLAYLKLLGRGSENGPVRYFDRHEVEAMFADFKKAEIHPFGFSVMPKTILGLPTPLRLPYRRFYDRVHRFLSVRLPVRTRSRFCTHFDVVART